MTSISRLYQSWTRSLRSQHVQGEARSVRMREKGGFIRAFARGRRYPDLQSPYCPVILGPSSETHSASPVARELKCNPGSAELEGVRRGPCGVRGRRRTTLLGLVWGGLIFFFDLINQRAGFRSCHFIPRQAARSRACGGETSLDLCGTFFWIFV